MKPNTIHTTVFAAAAMLLLAACQERASDQAAQYNRVEFSQTAVVKVPNDVMHVSLTVMEQGTNRAAAADGLTRKFNAVKEAVAKHPQVVMELGGRSAYPQYHNGRISRWEEHVQLNLKSSDFDLLAKVLAEVQEQAMIEDMSFAVSPEKQAEAVRQAGDQVLDAYRSRADYLREKMGYSGYKVVKLQWQDEFSDHVLAKQPVADAAAVATEQAAVMDVEDVAGGQEVRQTLHVVLQMY